MLNVIFWTIMFSLVTVISIVLTGSRSLISGDINLIRIIQIIFSWQFILAAGFAFLARMFFIMVNNSLLKIPNLAQSSTSITAFITSIAMIFVVIANVYFLHEKINFTQGIGATLMLIGVWFLLK